MHEPSSTAGQKPVRHGADQTNRVQSDQLREKAERDGEHLYRKYTHPKGSPPDGIMTTREDQ